MAFFKRDTPKVILVIEAGKEFSSALFFASQGNDVFLMRLEKVPGELPESIFRLLDKVGKSFPKVNLKSIVLVLDKSLAYSFLARGTFVRNNFKFSINQQELETALQKIERQLYEKHRNLAKWQLKASLEELEFGFVWVDKIFIDDHLVKNPVGFKGKSIGFLIGNTLLKSSLLEKLQDSLNSLYLSYLRKLGKSVFKDPSLRETKIILVEKNISLVQLLSSLSSFRFLFLGSFPKEMFLAHIDAFFGSSDLFFLEKGLYDLMIDRLSEEFSVDRDSAEKIFRLYKDNKLSSKWQRSLKVLDKAIFRVFADLVYYLIKKVPRHRLSPSERILIYPESEFWPDMSLSLRKFFREKASLKTKLKITDFSFSGLEKDIGFKIGLRGKFGQKEKIFLYSYVFLGKLFEKEGISKYLKRVTRRIK